MRIVLDWSVIKTEEDFYKSFFTQVKAPTEHGRSLNALADSLIVGGINCVEPPYTLVSKNDELVLEDMEMFQGMFFGIVQEAKSEGRDISVVHE